MSGSYAIFLSLIGSYADPLESLGHVRIEDVRVTRRRLEVGVIERRCTSLRLPVSRRNLVPILCRTSWKRESPTPASARRGRRLHALMADRISAVP